MVVVVVVMMMMMIIIIIIIKPTVTTFPAPLPGSSEVDLKEELVRIWEMKTTYIIPLVHMYYPRRPPSQTDDTKV